MKDYNERYARHYPLKDFGFESQQKLAEAKILIIGAGGLGCPALQYLAASGVGTIGVADDDLVSLSNLQRQVLYSTEDIGLSKAAVAKLKLQKLNPEIIINDYKMAVSSSNALELIGEYDMVIDCTDNFGARYLINDACVLLQKPLIFGAVFQYEGQVAIFNVADNNGSKTNYRNLFPKPPNPQEVLDCNEAGVLGVLPGIIGIMQATEAIKLITGIGEVLNNRLMTFSILNYESFIIDIVQDGTSDAFLPKDEQAFRAANYNWLCENPLIEVEDLDDAIFLEKIKLSSTLVIDVRELNEVPRVDYAHLTIPLSILYEKIPAIFENKIILFCQTGKRSLKAAQLLYEKFGDSKQISHLKGGINGLQKIIK